MFDFESQILEPSLLEGIPSVESFEFGKNDSQYFSTFGVQIGPVIYENDFLRADLLWDVKTLKKYAKNASTKYSALLSIVDQNGTVEYVEDITVTASAISSKRIPEQVQLDLSDYIDEISNGSQIYLGISQRSRLGGKSTGKRGVAMATSMNLTDIVTGQDASKLEGLTTYSGERIDSMGLATSCGTKKIGIDWDLQDCKFEYVNLDGVQFGYSNQNEPPAYRRPVILSGTSFQGSSLKSTGWGYDPLDIIDDTFLNNYSYSQKWTTGERRNDPRSVVNLRYTDLSNARFMVHSNARAADGLNSSVITPPYNYPSVDFATLNGVDISAFNKIADQSPTFVTITNESGRNVELNSIVTHIFRPSDVTLKPGERYQAWGTTAWFEGDDIIINGNGLNIIANNPPYAEANVKVNGETVYDDGTIGYSGGSVYVNWLGNENGAKNWEIKFRA